jgi:hypothetical protein
MSHPTRALAFPSHFHPWSAVASLAATAILLFGLGPPARAAGIVVGDLPGTNGRWQSGRANVNAPASEVQHWFSDYNTWPQHFPDVQWAQGRGVTADGRQIVRFRSKVLGRTLTIRTRETRGLISYEGEGKDVTTQGKIYISPAGSNASVVDMQTTGEVHGIAGAVASEAYKRKKAIRKITVDLNAIVNLANERAGTQRPSG